MSQAKRPFRRLQFRSSSLLRMKLHRKHPFRNRSRCSPPKRFRDYEPAQASGEPDVDLTTLSSTMVYSEVYNMMYEPDRYLGKRIKMNGRFAVYENPNTGAVYTACIIMDATACCSQGLEFVLAGEHSYPADYPEPGTEITVVGTFQTYEENGYVDYHLVDAEMTE